MIEWVADTKNLNDYKDGSIRRSRVRLRPLPHRSHEEHPSDEQQYETEDTEQYRWKIVLGRFSRICHIRGVYCARCPDTEKCNNDPDDQKNKTDVPHCILLLCNSRVFLCKVKSRGSF
jgi:hypothetical protein